jgi:hypothetical protein
MARALPRVALNILYGNRIQRTDQFNQIGESGEEDPIWSAVEEFARSSPKPAGDARVRAARISPDRRNP